MAIVSVIFLASMAETNRVNASLDRLNFRLVITYQQSFYFKDNDTKN